MNAKDKFIIMVLNHLGFGVSSIIPENPNMFAGRINNFFKVSNLKVEENNEEKLVLNVDDEFCIEYEKDGHRAKSVKIVNKT